MQIQFDRRMFESSVDPFLKVKTEEETRLCELLVEILVNRLERPVMQQLGSDVFHQFS